MGQGKKKRCAGQRPLDLTKQLARLEGLDLPELVRMDTVALKKRGLPVRAETQTITLISHSI